MTRELIPHTKGQKYGMYTLIRRVENKHNQQRWLCRCDCGNKKEVFVGAIARGIIRSCGCYKGPRVGCGTKKGQMQARGELTGGTLWLPPKIELHDQKATRDTDCFFCKRNGFSQTNTLHTQIVCGKNEINMCYGCALAVAHRLWFKFFKKEYSKILRRG
jgi:hypothetical protein